MEQAKRGYLPEDEREFSKESLIKLKKAAKHIAYLLNEGYAIKNVSTFVGNHFLLSERQRLALVRSISANVQIALRRLKECDTDSLAGQTVYIDGFNTIITMEVALSGSLLFDCMDGTIRDLAGLRGTYRIIDVTPEAVKRIAQTLEAVQVKKAVFYLDSPVSNSGRLKSLIADIWQDYNLELDFEVIHDVDRVLMKLDHVVTADAIILDACQSWFNLVRLCMKDIATEPIKVWQEQEKYMSRPI